MVDVGDVGLRGRTRGPDDALRRLRGHPVTTPVRPGRGRGGVGLLALIAYVPLLLSSPGRMPADTKVYLYLSPGRLLSQAPLTWDTSQFGGWVPHQIIAYLWPQGPWYWTFDQLGVPDWLAHRLWVGTILLLAALGTRWLARLLGLGGTAATVAGVVYMLSPYVLPYLSRTSAMLLPWAALGWIVGLTIRAATSETSRWRHAALLALVLLSCSAVNATAVLMIAPAPVLWLLDAAHRGRITWRRATSTAVRIGILALGVSAWWITMLRTQGSVGADVLGFSESLEATSFTTLATETLRGTGYWLFYIRDDATFATSASQALMENPAVLALTYVLPLVGLLGLALVRWPGRRWAATTLVVGMVLAVGVHPITDPSPLMSGIAENSRSGLALALRSSARATPLVVLALSLGLAALLRSIDSRRRAATPWSALAPAAAVAVALTAMPVVWTAGMVDPDLD
ncbi:MAG: alpha-(1-_3)-arabinofuranosyltransferase domain-containing protein, partial [Ilumatobacteraceae bacterium]